MICSSCEKEIPANRPGARCPKCKEIVHESDRCTKIHTDRHMEEDKQAARVARAEERRLRASPVKPQPGTGRARRRPKKKPKRKSRLPQKRVLGKDHGGPPGRWISTRWFERDPGAPDIWPQYVEVVPSAGDAETVVAIRGWEGMIPFSWLGQHYHEITDSQGTALGILNEIRKIPKGALGT